MAYTMRDGVLIEQDADIPEEAKAQLGITFEQAKEQMQRFFEAAGVGSASKPRIYVIVIYPSSTQKNTSTESAMALNGRSSVRMRPQMARPLTK